ncbi:hypothetical protein ACFVUH_18810 [Kitasatospora sp. NPDC058032]|uniref:hypothetical protein n=1 Tax=Kitasatospora sp. NPDC058032 TaxID=3346307 RepID=UPI0036DEEDB5
MAVVLSTDYDTRKRLRADAKVRDVSAMAARYQHGTGGILKDAAKRMGGLIWQVAKGADDGSPKAPEPRR